MPRSAVVVGDGAKGGNAVKYQRAGARLTLLRGYACQLTPGCSSRHEAGRSSPRGNLDLCCEGVVVNASRQNRPRFIKDRIHLRARSGPILTCVNGRISWELHLHDRCTEASEPASGFQHETPVIPLHRHRIGGRLGRRRICQRLQQERKVVPCTFCANVAHEFVLEPPRPPERLACRRSAISLR